MAKCKYIYWRNDIDKNDKGHRFANVHLLFGYNEATVANLIKMADELRNTFPEAGNDQICCGRITKSSCVNNFTIIAYNAHIPEGDYPGWSQLDNKNPDYYWQ